jgi:hypothetical protein
MTEQGKHRLPSKMILLSSAIAIGALVAIHLLLQYLNLEVFNEANGRIFELSNRFDLDDESSVPTWFSQFLLLAIGLVSGLAAYLQKERAMRWVWGVVAFLGITMSIDEIASLHEHSLQTIHVYFFDEAAPTITENAWLLVLPIILVFATMFGYVLYRYFPRRTSGLFILGGTIFLTGAVAVDALSDVTLSSAFLQQGILVAIEESLELAGSAVVLYAVIDYLERFRRKELAKTLQIISKAL